MRIRIPSPAAVIASLALLLSLTGTAVASGLITGAQIQNNTVGSLDLTNNGVKSVDLTDNGIKSIDVMNGQLQGSRLRARADPGRPRRPRWPRRTCRSARCPRPRRRGDRYRRDREQLELAAAGRRDVPGGQAARRRRRPGLRRQRRSRSRRELPGGCHQVARHGLRSERHRVELAYRRLRDLRSRLVAPPANPATCAPPRRGASA